MRVQLGRWLKTGAFSPQTPPRLAQKAARAGLQNQQHFAVMRCHSSLIYFGAISRIAALISSIAAVTSLCSRSGAPVSRPPVGRRRTVLLAS